MWGWVTWGISSQVGTVWVHQNCRCWGQYADSISVAEEGGRRGREETGGTGVVEGRQGGRIVVGVVVVQVRE